MQETVSDTSEEIVQHQNNNHFDDEILSIGSAKTLQRAMKVNKLSDMFDCIKDMKSYANTVEKDVPDYFNTIYPNHTNGIHGSKSNTDDFIQLTEQHVDHHRYILLNDLINQEKKSTDYQLHQHSTTANPRNSFLAKQVEYMKRVITAQPTALDAIYLEALLNPDQWQSNHQLLQTSPMDILTVNERKRLNEILSQYD